jgi:hypothetical protein
MATVLLKLLRPIGRTAADLKKECHLGKRKAESSIRIGVFDDTRDIGYARSGVGCCTCRDSPGTLVNAACTEPRVKNAKQAKKLVEKYGAEFLRISRFHTGLWGGESLVVTRYSSWEEFGKAQEGLANDPAWAKLIANTAGFAKLMGRNISVSVEL